MPFKFGLGRGQDQRNGQGCGCGCGSPGKGVHVGPPHTCVCSSCGQEMVRNPGDPCNAGKCPLCGGEMMKKD